MITRYDKVHTFSAIKTEGLTSSAKKQLKLCMKMVNI